MGPNADEIRQEREWDALFQNIRKTLAPWGVEDAFGKGDYLIVDDNYGYRRQKIEVHQLRMFNPDVVEALQRLLKDYPNWKVIMSLDVPGKEAWPPMGLTIDANEIVDDLQRQFLPAEYRNIKFFGSRPG